MPSITIDIAVPSVETDLGLLLLCLQYSLFVVILWSYRCVLICFISYEVERVSNVDVSSLLFVLI